MNWWMRASQTSSFLASKVLKFWVLSLDQEIVILLLIVSFASKFLEDMEWFKFGVVMTPCHYVIFYVICSQKWSSQGDLCSKKSRKTEENAKRKTCHDLVKT
jgi:hypothetical protein